jgi:phosphate acetyltransferase
MMEIIEKIRRKASKLNKTIVLPEPEDQRVREAAKIIKKENIARIILLDKSKMTAGDKEKYAKEYFQLRKLKGISLDEARQTMEHPVYFAAMMVRDGKADGFVAGASHTTPDVARAAIYCIGTEERCGLALSCFIMVLPDSTCGENGTLIFSDCGIVPEPNPRQLSCIAIASAQMANEVLDFNPRVALLSYSTKGSSKGKSVEKIREALRLTREMKPDLLVDGEIQVDAAIIPEVAKIKCPESPLKGKANVLIFPDLEAGNISYKLVQRLGKARALGPLLLGLKKPCCDLSRGCNIDDIIDCVAVTAIRAREPA